MDIARVDALRSSGLNVLQPVIAGERGTDGIGDGATRELHPHVVDPSVALLVGCRVVVRDNQFRFPRFEPDLRGGGRRVGGGCGHGRDFRPADGENEFAVAVAASYAIFEGHVVDSVHRRIDRGGERLDACLRPERLENKGVCPVQSRTCGHKRLLLRKKPFGIACYSGGCPACCDFTACALLQSEFRIPAFAGIVFVV